MPEATISIIYLKIYSSLYISTLRQIDRQASVIYGSSKDLIKRFTVDIQNSKLSQRIGVNL